MSREDDSRLISFIEYRNSAYSTVTDLARFLG